jgi:hypothetical protein
MHPSASLPIKSFDVSSDPSPHEIHQITLHPTSVPSHHINSPAYNTVIQAGIYTRSLKQLLISKDRCSGKGFGDLPGPGGVGAVPGRLAVGRSAQALIRAAGEWEGVLMRGRLIGKGGCAWARWLF